MGFGLHIGWAIEGAIGSEYKIDASYLSPNVNMASRLEAATKQFGVHILISEDLYQMSTPSMKKFCRNIDRVTVKGSEKPIKLYTIDLKLDNISPPMDKNLKYKNS
jgi:class 3 adenylate cyclase